ncbi:MAG: PAC2 family protein [Microbacteriaceae bacterium]
MLDPSGLYDISRDAAEVPLGLPLVAGLTGFADAGGAVAQLNEYLVEVLDTRVVAHFDADSLLDYRARRPTIFFDEDHLGEFRPVSLDLRLATDDLGQPFLLLTGYEPDFQWERFTAAVLQLIERYRVRSTTWVNAIPVPVPHTRPIRVTVSGNRPDLIGSMSVWRPRTEAPANALHMLEFRLQKLEHPIAGFVLLVPHYLADTEYPAAAITAIESITAATGLIFPTDRLRAESRDFLAKIGSQVESNAELSRLVARLEQQHDSYLLDNPPPSPLADADGGLPSAEDIAAELEDFLASRRDDDAD